MISLEQALRSVVGVLNRQGIPYAVMGGLAVRVYAIPRFTNDVDVTVSMDRASLPALFESLESIGFAIPSVYRRGWLDSVAGLPLFKADFHSEERIIEIDIFVSETPFQESLIKRRTSIDTSDGTISFVSPEDLVLLKLIASRPRDLIDVQDIFFTMGQLDRFYLDHWANELSISERLQAAFAQNECESHGDS